MGSVSQRTQNTPAHRDLHGLCPALTVLSSCLRQLSGSPSGDIRRNASTSIGQSYLTVITSELDGPQGDPGLEALLDLDGEAFVIDPAGQYWVYFRVRRVLRTPDKPHGLQYSMTLHGPEGKRLVGFDNAHPV